MIKDQPKGILFTFFGVLCASPDAVLTRFLSEGGTNSWTIIFWKALFSTTVSASFAVYGAGDVAALWISIMVGRRYYAVAVPIAASIVSLSNTSCPISVIYYTFHDFLCNTHVQCVVPFILITFLAI